MKKVLLVDDDPEMLEYFGLVLQRNGYSVRLAASGAEALQRLVEERIDLLVTDIDVPLMDGLQLLLQIRSLGYGDLPAIVMTARGCPESRRKAEKAGACIYLQKPIVLREFNVAVNRALMPKSLILPDSVVKL
jgi:two-component system chemotaxis response regulator CheY